MTNCILYIKKKQYKSYIKPKKHSDKYDKSCICDEYIYYKKHYQYIQKKYCTQYKKYTNKKSYQKYDKMLPK